MDTAKKFTRYTTTEYNRSERVLARLRNVYSCARSFHSTHDEILAHLDRDIYKTRDYEKLTTYYRGVFDGMSRAIRDALWERDLKWRLYLDGRLVDSKDVPAGRWSDVKGGAHVWIDAPDRIFTDAPAKPQTTEVRDVQSIHDGQIVQGPQIVAKGDK